MEAYCNCPRERVSNVPGEIAKVPLVLLATILFPLIFILFLPPLSFGSEGVYAGDCSNTPNSAAICLDTTATPSVVKMWNSSTNTWQYPSFSIPQPQINNPTSVNILSYGVNNTGDTSQAVSNAQKFNKAISDLNSNGGGELFIPDGTYMLAKDTSNSVIIRLKSHIYIRCASHNAILKSSTQLSNSTRIMGIADNNGATYTDIFIEGCTLDGSDTTVPTTGQEHDLFFWTANPGSISNVIVKDNILMNTPGDGINMSNNTSEFWVVNNHCENNWRWGISAGTGGSSRRGGYYIIGNRTIPSVGMATSGIDVEVATNVYDVVIEGNFARAIDVSEPASSTSGGGWIVNGNSVYGGSIVIANGTGVVVSNNTVSRTDSKGGSNAIAVRQENNQVIIEGNAVTVTPDLYGIAVNGGSYPCSDFLISNNTVIGQASTSTKAGILTQYCAGPIMVTGNGVSGFNTGIQALGQSGQATNDVHIQNNVSKGATYGVYLGDYVTGAIISDNKADGGTDDIYLSGTNMNSSGVVIGCNLLVHGTLKNALSMTFSVDCPPL